MSRSVDDYIATLSGWQAKTVTALRRDIVATGSVTEAVKWGHPVYEANGPVCLIKAHQGHVTLGFWRGTELKAFEPRLEAGSGGATMASVKLRGPGEIDAETMSRLVAAGVALNRERGHP